jgi:hypothetical protein
MFCARKRAPARAAAQVASADVRDALFRPHGATKITTCERFAELPIIVGSGALQKA